MSDAAAHPAGPSIPHFDLLIVDGTLVDGTAAAVPYRADVGVLRGRIAAIGNLDGATGDETIEASGSIVAPGFIDPHTHVETALLTDGLDALAPVLQGVTTCLTAPDGFGWAPLLESQARDLWTATTGIHDPWPDDLRTESIGAYLDAFGARTTVNVLPQVPHAAVRYAIAGWDAGVVTGRRLDRMRGLARDWMDAGATGLAVGLDYEPGARADADELAALCDVVTERGGTIAAHIRYQDAGRAAAWDEMAQLGRRTGVGVVIAHETLDEEGAALLKRGQELTDISIETYLYPASSTHLAMFVSVADRIGGARAIAERLRHSGERVRIETELRVRLEHELAAGQQIVFAWSTDEDRIGRDLAVEAEREHADIGAFAASVLRDDPDALFVFHGPGSDAATDAAVRTIADPATIVASDGIYRQGRTHPRGYGTFPRILRVAVREWNAITLPQAIHAMTGRTAARYRVPERGVLATDMHADLVVFDPVAVTDRATWLEPRIAPRGISHVIVDGEVVVHDGRATGARPGRVLAAV